MRKSVFFGLMMGWVSVLWSQDVSYYQMHPVALQKAIKECPKEPKGMSCLELKMLATKVNELAYELQIGPQQFGQKILAIQEAIARAQSDLSENPNQPGLQSFIKQQDAQLQERLAIVKWLESPK